MNVSMDSKNDGTSVAIIGAGNGGYSLAGDLGSRGYSVNLYEHPNFADGFSEVRDKKEVSISGALGSHKVKLQVATTDIAEAVNGVKIVNLVVPSTAQSLFFDELVNVLTEDQTLVVWAGRFGSLEMVRKLKEKNIAPKFTIAEVDTLPYGARKAGPSSANIFYTSRRLYVSTIQVNKNEEICLTLNSMFSNVKPLKNVLAVAFSNPALVVYGVGALLNAARIQHTNGKFYLFAEGITESVAEVMYRAYMEMTAVAHSYGAFMPEYQRKDFDGPLSLEDVVFESPDGNEGFAKMDGPSDIRGRYMMENIGDAIAPIAEFGDIAGVDTPLLDAITTLGSVICGTDFRTEGRNLTRLGLSGLTMQQILSIVENDF
jgi:opine dehydrogenase